jgi:hypothetical protein
MKKLVFGLIAMVMVSNLSFGQESNEGWKEMMEKKVT